MDKYLKQNKDHWNEITPIHEGSEMYDVAGFIAGKCTLQPTELKEIGDVKGKSVLHLQCHFGLDTLSWGRLGAKVTGVDFSDESIKLARKLSRETGIEATFIEADIYTLPEILKEKFDIVFTSYGALCWLPDLEKWARVISHFLKPGGFFYIIEGHPVMNIFDNSVNARELKIQWSYFDNPEWLECKQEGDYADPSFTGSTNSAQWAHSLSDIINALIVAGLKIDFLHEFPTGFFRALSFMKQDKDGSWRLDGDKLPITFSLKASKPLP
jgi:SAM-dependent methyltransferase